MKALAWLGNRGRSGLRPATVAMPVLLFVMLGILSPTFLSLENIANVNGQITALLIVALGQLIVALTGGIDLSVGGIVSLTSVILVTLAPSLSIWVAAAGGIVVGLVNGIGITVIGVHPIIMTLATMTFLQGLSLLILPVPGGQVPGFLSAVAINHVGGIPAAFFWCVIAIVAVGATLSRTRFGLRIFAIGANPESAGRNGIPVNLYRIVCYVLCALAGVIAGCFISARVSSGDATIGAPFALDSVTAIALGGVALAGGSGSVIGVVVGTLTLGLMTNGMNLLGVSPFLSMAATGVLLLIAISAQRRKVVGV